MTNAVLILPVKLDVEECSRLMALRDIRSRNALAIHAGINAGHLYRILSEDVSPTLDTVGKIANALGVRVRDILIDEPDDEPPT